MPHILVLLISLTFLLYYRFGLRTREFVRQGELEGGGRQEPGRRESQSGIGLGDKCCLWAYGGGLVHVGQILVMCLIISVLSVQLRVISVARNGSYWPPWPYNVLLTMLNFSCSRLTASSSSLSFFCWTRSSACSSLIFACSSSTSTSSTVLPSTCAIASR
jgi:hypothetical protein